jgi:hypothetical protein
MRAPVAIAAATPSSPASAPSPSATIAAAVTAVSARATVTADARWIVSRRVVTRGEILRGGSVRFRLAFFQIRGFASLFAVRARAFFVLLQAPAFTAQVFFFGAALSAANLCGIFVEADHLFVNSGRRQGFPRQQLDGGRTRLTHGGRGRHFSVTMAVFVVLEVFENVADVQESVAIQADVDESRLHAGEYPRHFSFVDASDERELFFTLNVDLN